MPLLRVFLVLWQHPKCDRTQECRRVARDPMHTERPVQLCCCGTVYRNACRSAAHPSPRHTPIPVPTVSLSALPCAARVYYRFLEEERTLVVTPPLVNDKE